MSSPEIQPITLYPLAGRPYTVKSNGNRSLNGALYGQTMFGEIGDVAPGKTIWDVLHAIVHQAEKDHAKMEHVECIQITVHRPKP